MFFSVRLWRTVHPVWRGPLRPHVRNEFNLLLAQTAVLDWITSEPEGCTRASRSYGSCVKNCLPFTYSPLYKVFIRFHGDLTIQIRDTFLIKAAPTLLVWTSCCLCRVFLSNWIVLSKNKLLYFIRLSSIKWTFELKKWIIFDKYVILLACFSVVYIWTLHSRSLFWKRTRINKNKRCPENGHDSLKRWNRIGHNRESKNWFENAHSYKYRGQGIVYHKS